MKADWNHQFGDDFLVELKNGERKYFGLNEIPSDCETTIFISKTNYWYKRTTVFWEENTIVKVVVEENRVDKEGIANLCSYQEYDTVLETENREMLLPLTGRGKKKKVSPTNILAVTPFGCSFYIQLDLRNEPSDSFIVVHNLRNNQQLAVGEETTIQKIKDNEGFRAFIKEYIATCPENYFEKVDRMRNEKHKTIKYRPGDVFRVEVDRFRYCYGIITGEVKQIRKWTELPERHSLRSLMMVPIMVRYYQVVTSDGDLTLSDLEKFSLGRVKLCGDNDIIWGTHPIVAHKELTAGDIEFNLVCTKFTSENVHSTVFTEDSLMSDRLIMLPEKYNLYVEWGTAVTRVPYSKLSEKLREYLMTYRSPHGGVSMGIKPYLLTIPQEEKINRWDYKFNLLEEINREMREELFDCLGLKSDAGFDDFAEKFGGLSKEEIVKRM